MRRKLSSLNLHQQLLGGTLPPEFGFNTSFPALTNLILMQNQLSGVCVLWVWVWVWM